MINRELFEKTKEMCGSYFTGGVSETIIKDFERKIGAKFPKSYISFLKEFGEGGISGTYIFGISDFDFSSALKDTNKYRESQGLPEYYIVVERCKTLESEWLTCLDTSRMKDGECPAIKYVVGTGEITEYAENFDEVFNKAVERKYLQRREL